MIKTKTRAKKYPDYQEIQRKKLADWYKPDAIRERRKNWKLSSDYFYSLPIAQLHRKIEQESQQPNPEFLMLLQIRENLREVPWWLGGDADWRGNPSPTEIHYYHIP